MPSIGDWDGDCQMLRTLDPEENVSLRPDFGGQGPYARLGEPLQDSSTLLKVTNHKALFTPETSAGVSRTRMASEKSVQVNGMETAGGTPQNVINLSDDDDDFNSPKSRRHKLTAKRSWFASKLAFSSIERLRSTSTVGNRPQSDGPTIKSETVDEPGNTGLPSLVCNTSLHGESEAHILQLRNAVQHQSDSLMTQEQGPSDEGNDVQESMPAMMQQHTEVLNPQLPGPLELLSQKQDHVLNEKRCSSKDSFWPEERKRALANAARKVLLADRRNCGKTLFTTTVQNILDETFSYESFCKLLERRGFSFERKTLAQHLLAVVPTKQRIASWDQLQSDPNSLNIDNIVASQPPGIAAVAPLCTKINSTLSAQASATPEDICQPAAGHEITSTPQLKAPIANMGFRPVPSASEHGSEPTVPCRPDAARPLNGEAETEGYQNSLEDASNEVMQGALSEMGNMIRLQKENANMENGYRVFQERSRQASVRRSSNSKRGIDNTKRSRNASRRSPSHSESELFFPDSTDPTAASLWPKQESIGFHTWSKHDGEAKMSNQKRPREGPTIDDYFGRNKDPNLAAKVRMKSTLEAGHFARHKNRKGVLDQYANPQKSRRQDAFDGQEVDLDTAADEYDRVHGRHPTTGGKGISDATRRRWESNATAQAYPTPTDSIIDEDEFGEPESLYQYHVHIREWLTDESEADARLVQFGPFFTLAEANKVAENSVQRPSENNRDVIFRPGAWSYNYGQDDKGMQTHAVGSGGGSIEASVSRNVTPPDQLTLLPSNAFSIPLVLYLAKFQPTQVPMLNEDDFSGQSPPRTHNFPNLVLAITLKACTTLDLANKAAGAKWLELETKDLTDDGLDNHKRATSETFLRKQLRRMSEENGSFDRTSRDRSSGENYHVWVEMVEIEGPRN